VTELAFELQLLGAMARKDKTSGGPRDGSPLVSTPDSTVKEMPDHDGDLCAIYLTPGKGGKSRG
jgi:hypothetical protein